jgi:hypothetical protein
MIRDGCSTLARMPALSFSSWFTSTSDALSLLRFRRLPGFMAMCQVTLLLASGGIGQGELLGQVELAGSRAAGQTHAQLAGAVVYHPLVVARTVQALAVHAADDAGVVDAGVQPGGEGRQVGAVIELAQDHRAVHVTVCEVDQHFGADARGELAAPVGAGQGFCYACVHY